MRILSFLLIFGMATAANASFFSKGKAAFDKDGNCLPEVVTETARLYGELESLDKIATASQAQVQSPVKESQKKGWDGFKELNTKVKATRASIKKFSETYGDSACKAMVKGKETMFVAKERAAVLDQTAAGYEKMAEDWLKAIAKK